MDGTAEILVRITTRLTYPLLVVTMVAELLYFHDVHDIEPGHPA